MEAIIILAICIAVIAGIWKVFVKAGQPGWAAIIPIYNAYILLKIVGRPAAFMPGSRVTARWRITALCAYSACNQQGYG